MAWDSIKFGDAVKLTSGKTPSKARKDFWDGTVPWITASSMGKLYVSDSDNRITEKAVSEANMKFIKSGTPLLLVRGSTLHNRIPITRPIVDVTINQDVKALTLTSKKIDEDFFFAWLIGMEKKLLEKVDFTGIGAGKLDTDVLNKLEIPLPNMKTQKWIGNFVNCINKKIEINEQINKKLESLANTIFKSWFIDFDPSYAKKLALEKGLGMAIAERATLAVICGICSPAEFAERPDEMDRLLTSQLETLSNDKKEELNFIATLFPDKLNKDDFGICPDGWEHKPLSDLITFNPRLTLKKGTVAKYIDMKALPTSGHRVDNIIHREFKSGSKFQNGDVLMARITPCLENGKTAYIDCLEGDEVAWGSTEFIVLRPERELPSHWVYLLSRSEKFVKFAVANMSGTSGRQRVPSTVLENYQFPFSSMELLDAFGKFTKPYFDKIKAGTIENNTLEKLREIILPKLFDNEIDLSKIEAIDNE